VLAVIGTEAEERPVAHVLGMLNRTISLIEAGIKPVWVFDARKGENAATVTEERKQATPRVT
jgi:5'-3' exonuclease